MSCRIVIFVGTLLACWSAIDGTVLGEEPKWQFDYKTARLEAASKGRLLVIHFTTNNCYWCKRLESETFSQAKIAGLINQRCVSLKVDGRRDPTLIEALRIKSYPTVVFACPDGRILEIQEGFEDAARFQTRLDRTLATVEALDHMANDYEDALRAMKAANYPRALTLLKEIAADGKDRPVQIKAGQALREIESQAAEKLKQIQQLANKGERASADSLDKDLQTKYAGTQAANEAKAWAASLVSRPASVPDKRVMEARDLLAKAKDDQVAGLYHSCLERCETLIRDYADLNEAGDAVQLASTIKSDPEIMKVTCERLNDRLATLYLDQAEAWSKKGNVSQANQCLERVVRMFPGSLQAQKARERITLLQSR